MQQHYEHMVELNNENPKTKTPPNSFITKEKDWELKAKPGRLDLTILLILSLITIILITSYIQSYTVNNERFHYLVRFQQIPLKKIEKKYHREKL